MDAKRVAGALLLLAGTALAGELVVRAFDAIWTAIVGDGPLTPDAIRNVVGLVALVLGLCLLFWPSDKAKQKQQRLDNLVQNMTQLRLRLGTGSTRDARLFGEIASVYYGLDKLGIMTPNQVGEPADVDHYSVALAFISNILPMVRDGHLKEAREQAPAIIKPLGVKASRFKMPLYRRVWPLKVFWGRPAAA